MFSLRCFKRSKITLIITLPAMLICAMEIYADSDGGYISDPSLY